MLGKRGWAVASIAVLALSLVGISLELRDSSSPQKGNFVPPDYSFHVDLLQRFTPKCHIAFLGDSHIARVDWNALLGRSDTANFGIGGDETKGVLSRLQPVIASGARHVVLLIGINDLMKGRKPDEIADDIREIIRQIQQSSEITVVSVMTTSGMYASINDRVRELDEKLRNICINECRFIDVLSITGKYILNEKYSLDGVHLNVDGYAEIAEAIKPSLPEKDESQ